jgi:hypothetical protein
VFVMGFYGGMIAIDLVAYPLLERWRSWLRTRGGLAGLDHLRRAYLPRRRRRS